MTRVRDTGVHVHSVHVLEVDLKPFASALGQLHNAYISAVVLYVFVVVNSCCTDMIVCCV